jgi:predicted RNase H-like nuclease (RuvC/YqgF family)
MTRLVTVKGQLNKVQHENQNLSNKLKEAKWVVRKIENLQQEYAEFNQFNSKPHNDLKHL